MNKREFNKIIASSIIAILIIILINKFANFLSKSSKIEVVTRGYSIITSMQNQSTINKEQSIQKNNININEEGILTADEIEALITKALKDKETAILNGKKIIKKCISCHTFEKNGINKIGPNLANIYNSKKANNQSYSYSSSLLNLTGNWNSHDLFYFLQNPKKFASGTKMVFPGLSSSKEIVDVIIFLKDIAENN